MEERLLAKVRFCSNCGDEMNLVKCNDRSDGLLWKCRKQVDGKKHRVEMSIWKDTWFEGSRWTLEEILKFTYLWCQDLDQRQIAHELGFAAQSGVDWDNFCREVCEVTLLENSERRWARKNCSNRWKQVWKAKIPSGTSRRWAVGIWRDRGGQSKMLLSCSGQEGRSNFAADNSRKIEPGTVIVSDCWAAYKKLEQHGYTHRTVNHSKEFVNEDGQHTNKIEGHWRQAKAKLPTFGVRKYFFSSYLAEFMWRYMHKDEDLFDLQIRMKTLYLWHWWGLINECKLEQFCREIGSIMNEWIK